MKIQDFFVNFSTLPEVTIYTFSNSLKKTIFGVERLSIKVLAIYFLIAGVVYLFSKNQIGKKSFKKFFGFVLPKKIYLHSSFKMDLKVFLIRLFFNPSKLITFSVLSVSLAMAMSNYLQNNLASLGGKIESNKINLFLITLVGFLIYDFSMYLVHRIFHVYPLLWPFHSLHHSAEVLNPLTAKRIHFVWDIFEDLFFNVFLGLGQGILMWAGDTHVNPYEIFKFTIIINFFNFLVGNLHHSHIWISFGFLDRIFLSPALHQLHHSSDTKHRNKNFGLFLSIWDQIFGTIYVPKEKENLVYGIESGVKNPHDTLLKFYFLPFKESWLVLKNNIRRLWEAVIPVTEKTMVQGSLQIKD